MIKIAQSIWYYWCKNTLNIWADGNLAVWISTILSRFRKFRQEQFSYDISLSNFHRNYDNSRCPCYFYCPNSVGISTLFTGITSGFTDYTFIVQFSLSRIHGYSSSLELVHLCRYVIVLTFPASSLTPSLLAWSFDTVCLLFSRSGLSIIYHFVSIA